MERSSRPAQYTARNPGFDNHTRGIGDGGANSYSQGVASPPDRPTPAPRRTRDSHLHNVRVDEHQNQQKWRQDSGDFLSQYDSIRATAGSVNHESNRQGGPGNGLSTIKSMNSRGTGERFFDTAAAFEASPPRPVQPSQQSSGSLFFQDHQVRGGGHAVGLVDRDEKVKTLESVETKSQRWFEELRDTGRQVGLIDKVPAAPVDRVIPVILLLLVKEIIEDEQGRLNVIGTVIQNQIGLSIKNDKDSVFDVRVNDLTSTDAMLSARQKVYFGAGSATTYNCRLPTKIRSVFTGFPFQIFECTVMLELSTKTKEVLREDNMTLQWFRLRPDLYLNITDERKTVVIRDAGREQLNCTKSYQLLNESPMVQVVGNAMTIGGTKQVCAMFSATPTPRAGACQ